MILCHVARWALLLLICQMSCLSMHAPARAQDFYRGKTLTIVVGFTPGGGFDINARLLARHIGRHIPGKPDHCGAEHAGRGRPQQRAIS